MKAGEAVTHSRGSEGHTAIFLLGGNVLLGSADTLQRTNVLIEGDLIAAVGTELAPPNGARIIDATAHIVLPGLVNAHTHSQNNILRGAGDTWTLEDQLNHGQAVYASRSAEDQYVSAALNAVEMIRTGCTCAYDLFIAFPYPTIDEVDAVVRAYQDVGLRATVAPTISDRNFYETVPGLEGMVPAELRERAFSDNSGPTKDLLQLARESVQRWHGAANGRIQMGVAPTIPNLCSDALLTGCAEIAQDLNVTLHTHLAETKPQCIFCEDRWGGTIVDRLSELQVLSPRFVGAHSVWLTDSDMAKLAAANASVVHLPASNLKLGSGIAPVRAMLDAGITVGLGTDGSMSSDNQSMFEAMRFAANVSKILYPYQARRWLGSRPVWTMATLGSAETMGLERQLGQIEPGRKADIALFRADSMFLKPMSDVLNSMIYVEPGTSASTVIVDGRVVLDEGQIVGVDEVALRDRAQEILDRARDSRRREWELAEAMAPYIESACRAVMNRPFPVYRFLGEPA